MKILAIAGAAVILAALAFLHPAPKSPALQVAAGASGSRPGARSRRTKSGRAAAPALVIYVAGEVRRPGLYRVPPGARANDAVQKAGSFSSAADRAAVNLAEIVQDGEEIRVPRIGESAPRTARRRNTTRKKRARVSTSVDLNSASAGELAQVPGLGATLAQRIVAYRAQNGPFASLDELADVSGFTPRRIDALAQYLVLR
ncbi:MAG TPA: ComEA family DNA-binding protein [Candidatus Rubrimentiphilum sp.]|nr:ComEA family DNA-binding protein [Candidatus Rubrimentiphilum sp.]